MSRVVTLLERLDGVKQLAPSRWMARCPAHQDRSPSFSVRELEDGRVLLHCFAGCEVGDILSSLGMSFRDLYPERLSGSGYSPIRVRIPPGERLVLVDHEVTVAALILADVLAARTVDESQWQRLAQAAARIGEARDHGSA